jgi:hypothetical protein
MDDQQVAHLIGQLVTAAVVLFVVYRRFRRNFGKQLLRRVRMTIRLVVLSCVGLLLLPLALRATETALVIAGGLAVGIGLGVWAAKHLRFEKHDDKLYYIPHTYAGMIVTALFLGRFLYRFVTMYSRYTALSAGSDAPPPDAGFDALYANPLTLSILFVLIGYYVYYYVYVLWESRHLKPEDFENATANETKN